MMSVTFEAPLIVIRDGDGVLHIPSEDDKQTAECGLAGLPQDWPMGWAGLWCAACFGIAVGVE